MNNYLPVTQREYEFSAAEMLLSTTDMSNHITYANSAFTRTSGFPSEKLIEEKHVLVRHPDMPAVAFADMWRSLKSGQTWTALIKNLRQNGDYYWVRANLAPMYRNGQLVGVLSVRTKPSRAEVELTEAQYSRFNEGSKSGFAFHRGLIVRTGVSRWATVLQVLTTAWRVRLPLFLLASALGIVLNWSGLEGAMIGRVWAVIAVGLLLVDWFIEVQITSPLKKIQQNAQQVASGDASVAMRLNRSDDIGLIARAISQVGLNLHALVADVYEQAAGVQIASQEIFSATNDLSIRTEQTASSLEQTAAVMEQQTASVRQNSDTAQQASLLAQVATEVAAKGSDAMTSVVSTMAQISVSSRKISDIIQVIDGIAFQTNILALNAAVEAARAGDQGRGFAVVASEVRSLAGRSAAAAKEIKFLIDDAAEKVENGSRQVADAGQTMTEVMNQVKLVNDLMAEITEASKEQFIGISQVSQSISHLDEMTQQNASMVEQNIHVSISIGDKALRLVDAMKVFAVPKKA